MHGSTHSLEAEKSSRVDSNAEHQQNRQFGWSETPGKPPPSTEEMLSPAARDIAHLTCKQLEQHKNRCIVIDLPTIKASGSSPLSTEETAPQEAKATDLLTCK